MQLESEKKRGTPGGGCRLSDTVPSNPLLTPDSSTHSRTKAPAGAAPTPEKLLGKLVPQVCWDLRGPLPPRRPIWRDFWLVCSTSCRSAPRLCPASTLVPGGRVVISSPDPGEEGLPQHPRGPQRQRPLPLQEVSVKCCPRLLGMGQVGRRGPHPTPTPQPKSPAAQGKPLKKPLSQLPALSGGAGGFRQRPWYWPPPA